jgi:hypothetical protein
MLKWADFPALVELQSSTFEDLLNHGVLGSSFALEIKKAEMATNNLLTLVRVSDLKSREKIVETLRDFVEDARRSVRDLQKFNAKVGGAVDGYGSYFGL